MIDELDIEAVLAQLTLAEKVSLCHGATNFSVAGVERLGIPPLTMSDGPHGVRQELMSDGWEPCGADHDHITYLPTATATAATWNPACAAAFGRVLGEEARARGKDVILGPGVNIHRNPLCGRNFEYFSEDPFLTGQLAVCVIGAIQEQGTAACVKHYALNSQEYRRLSVDARPDERTLREIYLPAFEAAVKSGAVFTIMGAYNRFRGQHCCENDYLLNRILKEEWEFDGVVISDWAGCHDTFEAARFGLDIEMGTSADFANFHLAAPFLRALESGALPESLVDDKVRRILRLHAKLAAQRLDLPPAQCNTAAHQTVAREIAEEAMVLLKNDGPVLPLRPETVQKILVVGANAVNLHHAGGESSAVKALYEITPLEGLREVYGADRIDFEPGYPAALHCDRDWELDWTIGLYPRNAAQPAESWHATTLCCDWERDVPAAYADHHGKLMATADFTAPSAGTWTFALYGGIHATLHTSLERYRFPMTEALPGVPHTLRVPLTAGQTIRLTVEYRRHPGKALDQLKLKVIPPGAEAAVDHSALLARARQADAVIFIGGQTHAQDFEGADRVDLELRDGQNELIAALAQANPRLTVVLAGGSAVTMPWLAAVPAVVQMWYAGCEGGRALARILSGAVNPSGKLPMTFPARLADLPQEVYQDYGPEVCNYQEGVLVGYRWFDRRQLAPLFPFGHGLSYTTFAYSDLKLKTYPKNGALVRVRCRVTNTGRCAGAEVVQLYVGNPDCSIPRPVRELKAFAKVWLQPGESSAIEFNLTEQELAFFHPVTRQWTVEYGRFTFELGSSSRDLRLSGTVDSGA